MVAWSEDFRERIVSMQESNMAVCAGDDQWALLDLNSVSAILPENAGGRGSANQG